MRFKREKLKALDRKSLTGSPCKDEKGPLSRQSGEHRTCFQSKVGETCERLDGAHMGFSERVDIDTVLN